jgi:hypothetical protein
MQGGLALNALKNSDSLIALVLWCGRCGVRRLLEDCGFLRLSRLSRLMVSREWTPLWMRQAGSGCQKVGYTDIRP